MERVEHSYSPGDVVYCVAGELEQPILVEKATVDSGLKYPNPDGLPYHYLLIWDRADRDPAGEGATVTKLPHELFTRDEIEQLLNQGKQDTHRDIDGILSHPLANHVLAGTIGGAVIERMVDTPQRLIEAHERTRVW